MQAVLYWFKERLRDVWLWPFNLVRDFPARSGRLAATLWAGGRAVLLFPLFIWQGLRSQTPQQSMRHWVRQTGIWLHLLLAQLFDLVGGPEICQLVMHLGMHTTPLTAVERSAVRSIFGAENLRYGDVRIAQGGILHLIFRYNGGLAFATWYTIYLPVKGQQKERNGRHNLPLLVHELTHVFQYHHVGSRYLGEAIYYLVTTQRNCYQYGGSAGLQSCWQQGKSLAQFNREQQAQIVQDYFAKLQAGEDTAVYLRYIKQLQKRHL